VRVAVVRVAHVRMGVDEPNMSMHVRVRFGCIDTGWMVMPMVFVMHV
jgi:hypothetical protein